MYHTWRDSHWPTLSLVLRTSRYLYLLEQISFGISLVTTLSGVMVLKLLVPDWGMYCLDRNSTSIPQLCIKLPECCHKPWHWCIRVTKVLGSVRCYGHYQIFRQDFPGTVFQQSHSLARRRVLQCQDSLERRSPTNSQQLFYMPKKDTITCPLARTDSRHVTDLWQNIEGASLPRLY